MTYSHRIPSITSEIHWNPHFFWWKLPKFSWHPSESVARKGGLHHSEVDAESRGAPLAWKTGKSWEVAVPKKWFSHPRIAPWPTRIIIFSHSRIVIWRTKINPKWSKHRDLMRFGHAEWWCCMIWLVILSSLHCSKMAMEITEICVFLIWYLCVCHWHRQTFS